MFLDYRKLNKTMLEKFLGNEKEDRGCSVCFQEIDGNVCDNCMTFTCDVCCRKLREYVEEQGLRMFISLCPVCKSPLSFQTL